MDNINLQDEEKSQTEKSSILQSIQEKRNNNIKIKNYTEDEIDIIRSNLVKFRNISYGETILKSELDNILLDYKNIYGVRFNIEQEGDNFIFTSNEKFKQEYKFIGIQEINGDMKLKLIRNNYHNYLFGLEEMPNRDYSVLKYKYINDDIGKYIFYIHPKDVKYDVFKIRHKIGLVFDLFNRDGVSDFEIVERGGNKYFSGILNSNYSLDSILLEKDGGIQTNKSVIDDNFIKFEDGEFQRILIKINDDVEIKTDNKSNIDKKNK